MQPSLRILAFAAIATSLFVVAGCSSGPAPILIGHVGDLHGPSGGADASEGVQLALHDLSKSDEAKKKRPIHARLADGGTNVSLWESQAARLIHLHHAWAIIGGRSDEEIHALERSGGLVLCLRGDRLPGVHENLVYLGTSKSRQTTVLIDYLRGQLKQTALTVVVDGETPPEALDAVRQACEAKEPKVAVTLIRADADGPAEPKKDKGLELILSQATLEKLLEKHGTGDERVLRRRPVLRTAPDRLVFVSEFVRHDQPESLKNFRKSYSESFGKEATLEAALAYEGTRLLSGALAKAPLANPELIREELFKASESAGVAGPVRFEKKRVERTLFVVRRSTSNNAVSDEVVQVVAPSDAAKE